MEAEFTTDSRPLLLVEVPLLARTPTYRPVPGFVSATISAADYRPVNDPASSGSGALQKVLASRAAPSTGSRRAARAEQGGRPGERSLDNAADSAKQSYEHLWKWRAPGIYTLRCGGRTLA